jgi:hypothetical protein
MENAALGEGAKKLHGSSSGGYRPLRAALAREEAAERQKQARDRKWAREKDWRG